MLQKIIAYLATGCSTEDIMSMVGCSRKHIEEIQARNDYTELIDLAQKVKEKERRHETREDTYEDTEDAVLKAIKTNAPFASFPELTSILSVLHKRKQLSVTIPHGMHVVNNNQYNTVLLTIPQAAVPELKLNAQKEVIGIDDKSLAPMPSGQVRRMFDTMKARDKVIIDQTNPEAPIVISEHDF